MLTGLVVLARLLLAADYPIDAVYSLLLAWITVGFAFAFFVPEDVFPVSYARGGKAAHLDLGGARGDAIVAAVRDQLGFTVTEIEPFGLAGSGGSSPLRMRVAELDGHLFGKIYATSHLRADRWYKVGRTILYGQLEDEVPLGSVRRLALYEDYALRLLRDVGIGVATTYGIVELTPDREYMLVTEFFSNATTLGEAEVDDAIIDQGMELVQRLWASGLAHRDLKPANMLVRGGHLQLVDVSGLQVRPTPWRQAVDLANMMLTLALQQRSRPRLRARDHGLLPRRRRRGVRRRPRARDPDTGEREAEGGRCARSSSASASSRPIARSSRSRCGAFGASRSPRPQSSARSPSSRWSGRRSRSAWTDA